jgi:hypothetical protein
MRPWLCIKKMHMIFIHILFHKCILPCLHLQVSLYGICFKLDCLVAGQNDPEFWQKRKNIYDREVTKVGCIMHEQVWMMDPVPGWISRWLSSWIGTNNKVWSHACMWLKRRSGIAKLSEICTTSSSGVAKPQATLALARGVERKSRLTCRYSTVL